MAGDEGRRKARGGTSLPEVPDKRYFRIGEVAGLLSLQPYVLRFWESEFPHLRPFKSGTGQRLYRHRDVEALREVRRLLYDEGYTIAGARQWMDQRARGPSAPPAAEQALQTPQGQTSSHDTVRAVYTSLRELADLLGKPVRVDGGRRPSSMTLRRRTAQTGDMPSLFAPPHETDAGED